MYKFLFGSPQFSSYSEVADKAFESQIKRALAVVDDLRNPFRSIANDFYRSEKAIFKLKGPGQYPDFQGKKIGELREGPLKFARKNAKPIAEKYRNMTPYQYRKVFYMGGKGYPLLKFSGRLEQSVTSPDGKGSFLAIGKQVLAIGTKLPYAAFHQSDEPRNKIPLRKFLFVGPESVKYSSDKNITGRLERWNNILNDYILKMMKKQGVAGVVT